MDSRLSVAAADSSDTPFLGRLHLHGAECARDEGRWSPRQRVPRNGVGGVAERPTVKQWKNLQEAEIDDALNEFAWELEGSDDIHATAEYRRQLVRHLGRRSILEAKQCRL